LTDRAGSIRRLGANDVTLAVVETWRSEASGVTYPLVWDLKIPSAALAIRVTPRISDQEIRVSVRYWEGAVEVTGTDGDRSIGGRGYLELAGY
jgi:predicted secreted hydrolase